jgi:ABC-2 type transport system ATP-binding protein
VRTLNREFGTTVFLTTQYMEEADKLAGRISIIDDGKIVAEGTPSQLKERVGDPTLSIQLGRAAALEAERILLQFGEPAAAPEGSVAIRLPKGAAQVPAVVRALDEARIAVEGLELHMPTLDDVFLIATGRRLEGAEATVESEEVAG